MSALLYSLLEICEKGANLACTSKKQVWGKAKKFHEPDFLPQIPVKRFKSDGNIEQIDNNPKRFTFDPRAPCDRNPTGKCVFNLNQLAIVTNGDAAILKHLGVKVESQCTVECDANVECTEEVTTTQTPLPFLEQCEIIIKMTQI